VYLQVPSGLGTNGAATNATTTVFVLETVPSGGLQASIKARGAISLSRQPPPR
jgi:hypothetical protein